MIHLTPELVKDIRTRHRKGESVREIARSIGASHSTIVRAVTGVTWQDVPGALRPKAPSLPPHVPSVRPVCPRCRGLVEADVKAGKPFLCCEDCGTTWNGTVTAAEREQDRELSRDQLGQQHQEPGVAADTG